jgi:transposase
MPHRLPETSVLVLPTFDGHLKIAPSGAEGVRHVNEEPAEVHAGVQGRGCGDGRGRGWQRVAKELGIYDSTLGNWVRQAREQATGAPTVQERAEIRELRRELERTRRERDILAKAVAFFSGSPRISE